MFYPCTAIVAFLVRSAAPVALVLAFVWSPQAQSQPPVGAKNDQPAAVPQSVEVFGKVVDAETGKPVEAFITQAGKFDPKDPKNVTWGFSETRRHVGSISERRSSGTKAGRRAFSQTATYPSRFSARLPLPEKTESRR